MPSEFLDSMSGRSWDYDREGGEFEFYIGEGTNALEIVVTDHGERPTKKFLQKTYSDRRGGRANPILVVAIYDDKVGLCGPSGEEPPVYRDVDRGQAERVCEAALEQADRHLAQQFLNTVLPQLEEDLAGLRNQGLLSTHELKVGVPERDDWEDAAEHARQALDDDPQELVKGLGYEIERLPGQSYLLKDEEDEQERAVAVFLKEDESFDHSQERFGKPPVAYALSDADQKNLDYVIGSSGDTLRLYTTDADAGFGSRGRADTYVEVNTRLLSEENAGYLWLLFSAGALREEGTLDEIMERSKDYAADLSARLRERVYDDVVPDLAEAIADVRDLDNPTKAELDETYEMTLVLLYRLLFIAYAEDEEFLPRRRNERYDRESLKQKAHDLHQLVKEGGEFDSSSYRHWNDIMELSRAIHRGDTELGLPPYNGRLLSEDSSVSEAGAKLADIRLNNSQFGPILASLLIDETEDGYEGPVDFRNIGVQEFGVIYEGLLESEISVAEQPLVLEQDDGEEQYVPVDEEGQQKLGGEDIAVEEGEIYVHGQSGERKSTGTYYTKTEFVEHLLDYSLEPALDRHIERLDRLQEEEGENAAAEAFFDMRVADISMGSGHFLVGAVDRIESRLYKYLAENELSAVRKELDNLKEASTEAFENEEYAPRIEDTQLLRRQVARRCIYGVDINPLATELARLSVWVHTFVPGLPLTFLDYNLRSGDSIVGIGTVDEASDMLGEDGEGSSTLDMFADENAVSEIQKDIEKFGNFADTSAEKVAEARETRERIDEELSPVRARFDILAASQVDDDINPKDASNTDEDPHELDSYDRAQKILEPFDTFHFPVEFPEVFMEDDGFDVVVGNPPWDKVRFEPQQFWVTRHPGLNTVPASKRDDRMDELREKYPQQAKEEEREKQQREQYQEFVKNAYDDQGRGHYDYAKLFVERALNVLQDDGELGYVLPRQSLVLGGWKQLRRRLLDESKVTVLQARNAGGWIFENVEHRYMIILITSGPTSDESTTSIWPAIEEEDAFENLSSDDAIQLTQEAVANLTTESRMIVPWFDSEGARDVFPKMESRSRLSDDDGWLSGIHDTKWDFRSSGKHGDLANDSMEEGYWRVFMTRSLDQYAINEEKEFRRFVDPEDLLQESEVIEKDGKVVLDEGHPTVVFRHVSRNDDTRTMISSVLPESGFVYSAGYVHAVDHEDGATKEELLALTGYFNSFACDWWARRIVDRHVTSPLINNIPIPDWTEEQVEEVAELAGELIRRGGTEILPGGQAVPSRHEDLEEHEIRARIEKVVAEGFGLEMSQYEAILNDFSTKACSTELRTKIEENIKDD